MESGCSRVTNELLCQSLGTMSISVVLTTLAQSASRALAPSAVPAAAGELPMGGERVIRLGERESGEGGHDLLTRQVLPRQTTYVPQNRSGFGLRGFFARFRQLPGAECPVL